MLKIPRIYTIGNFNIFIQSLTYIYSIFGMKIYNNALCFPI